MPRVDYRRIDWPVEVIAGHGRVTVVFGGDGDATTSVDLDGDELVRTWVEGGVPVPLLAAATNALSLVDLAPGGSEDEGLIELRRCALRIAPALASLPWEEAIWGGAPGRQFPVVRVSDVRPRVLDLPMALPVRLLHLVDPGHGSTGPFPFWSPFDKPSVTRVATTVVPALDQWRGQSGWSTAEVVHLPVLDTGGVDRLSTAHAEVPGTLGWLDRLTATWQTRLVVLDCPDRADVAAANPLAAALVDRGGPCVVVAGVVQGDRTSVFQAFYSLLLHDRPADYCAREVRMACFGGAGREDALRISTIGENLVHIAAPPAAFDRPSYQGAPAPDVRPQIEEHLLRQWDDLRFEDHESEGAVPLAKAIDLLRGDLQIGGPRRAEPAIAPRYVNPALSYLSVDGSISPIDARAARPLEVGAAYHLSVAIGPSEASDVVIGARALIEEVLLWEPGDEGRWLEIALAGVDFAVTGSPVQQLWLPRYEPSQPVGFTVTPSRAGAAALRLSVYVDHNLVQSFRLGALTEGPPDPALLARLLDVDVDDLDGRTWLARLDYSLVGDGTDMLGQPERAVSILANDSDGRSVITVNTADGYAVQLDADLPDLVRRARAALSEIASPAKAGVSEMDMIYAFSSADATLNAGKPEQLSAALQALAPIGWELYNKLLPSDVWLALAAELAAPDRVVHVAHVLLGKVLPWALVYDRPYNATRRTVAGHPVDHATCLAGLPDASGRLTVSACGEAATCLLHESQRPAWVDEGNVGSYEEVIACPLRFWGFRHEIELPPGQVPATGEPAPPAPTVDAGAPPRLGVGVHAGLSRAAAHLVELGNLLPPAWNEGDADALTDLLATDIDLDLVYLYCHAEGGKETGIAKAALRVKRDQGVEGRIFPENLGSQPWPHHPFVILNGCRTAAFSPDALSFFVTKLTRDRKASGVLATEVTVWEQLATEVGRSFLAALLGHAPAGQALLDVRRRLLAKHNPLGLAYTLYARADLRIP